MTRKQQRMLRVLADARTAGKVLTIDEFLITLGVTSTKQSLQCSIRFLEGKTYLVRKYDRVEGKVRMLVELTELGFSIGKDMAL